MASLASCIRSAARATFSARRRIPIRWRLAGGSALLTLTILLVFAIVVGTLTTKRLYGEFDDEAAAAADSLAAQLRVAWSPARRGVTCTPDLGTYASTDRAVIRVVALDGRVVCATPDAPDLGPPRQGPSQRQGYRVETRAGPSLPLGRPTALQYARPLASVHRTVDKLRLLLILGVVGGAALALLAGLAIARRAMRPITDLTAAAREVRRTRDPARTIPHPPADDEVAELARTFEGMLEALDAARADTQAALERQRAFVADASHELRTPLTSVLANLELLAEHLGGEPREAAASALRSSRRMRRLVEDLLLLARADARRVGPGAPVDLARVLLDAAAELEAVSTSHPLCVDVEASEVVGVRDDLHRLALNLLTNALAHTPAGTHIRAGVRREGEHVVLDVADDGPGIPEPLRTRVFERFVRGVPRRGDEGRGRGGSSGLGLAIVQAVAEAHGGTVALTEGLGGRGACFTVRLPAAGRAGDGRATTSGDGSTAALRALRAG